MDKVKIGPIKLSQDGQRVDGVIRVGDQSYSIYFQTQEAQLQPNIEAFWRWLCCRVSGLPGGRLTWPGLFWMDSG